MVTEILLTKQAPCYQLGSFYIKKNSFTIPKTYAIQFPHKQQYCSPSTLPMALLLSGLYNVYHVVSPCHHGNLIFLDLFLSIKKENQKIKIDQKDGDRWQGPIM